MHPPKRNSPALLSEYTWRPCIAVAASTARERGLLLQRVLDRVRPEHPRRSSRHHAPWNEALHKDLNAAAGIRNHPRLPRRQAFETLPGDILSRLELPLLAA